MTTEHDPILDELWGDSELPAGEVDFGAPYGVGTWPKAVLMDVQEIADHQYGYRVGLVLHLKGEEGMKYTGRVNLPRAVEENGDPNAYEKALAREENARNNVSGLMLGADLLPAGKLVPNVNNEQDYEKIVSIFRHGIGREMPVRIKIQRKFNKDTGKYEDTEFTELVAIKARKGK